MAGPADVPALWIDELVHGLAVLQRINPPLVRKWSAAPLSNTRATFQGRMPSSECPVRLKAVLADRFGAGPGPDSGIDDRDG
jgi:hypothetical protein